MAGDCPHCGYARAVFSGTCTECGYDADMRVFRWVIVTDDFLSLVPESIRDVLIERHKLVTRDPSH